MGKWQRFLVGVGLAGALFADDGSGGWFTGTLLDYAPVNQDPGSLNLQPYWYEIYNYGTYTENWGISTAGQMLTSYPSLQFEFGILKWLDFTGIIQGAYVQADGASDVHFGPLQAWLGFQLLRSKPSAWTPNIRLLLFEEFPTGPYQKLNPTKAAAQVGSNGAFQTGVVLIIEKLFSLHNKNDFDIGLDLEYFFMSDVRVRGYNFYGGNQTTDGTASPGDILEIDLAIQYAFTQNWAVIGDINYIHEWETGFSGNAGTGLSTLAAPSSDLLSIAPGVSYSFSENFGIFGSLWGTVIGRNVPAFFGGAFSVIATF